MILLIPVFAEVVDEQLGAAADATETATASPLLLLSLTRMVIHGLIFPPESLNGPNVILYDINNINDEGQTQLECALVHEGVPHCFDNAQSPAIKTTITSHQDHQYLQLQQQ